MAFKCKYKAFCAEARRQLDLGRKNLICHHAYLSQSFDIVKGGMARKFVCYLAAQAHAWKTIIALQKSWQMRLALK